jgi:hypothetical protein
LDVSSPRSAIAALVATATVSLGCITRTTTTFSVRDPTAVSLETPDGRPVVPPEPSAAPGSELLVHGEHRALFVDVLYDVFAERAPDGSLHVSCPVCARAFHPPGLDRVPLVGSDRWTSPVAPDDVGTTPDALVLHERPCFVEGSKRCSAGAEAVLRIPWQDALLAREHTAPVRWVGAVAIAGGAPVILAGALDFALSPRDAPHGLGALGLGAIGAALVGVGLWYLLAPGGDEYVPAAAYHP